MFTIRTHGDEETETLIRERVGRCLVDWDGNIKWDCFVDFVR